MTNFVKRPYPRIGCIALLGGEMAKSALDQMAEAFDERNSKPSIAEYLTSILVQQKIAAEMAHDEVEKCSRLCVVAAFEVLIQTAVSEGWERTK